MKKKQYKQWFTLGPESYNEAICEKVTNKNFNLKKFARKFYYIDKKGSGYAVGNAEQRRTLGNRSYLMRILWDKDDIWLAPNEAFITEINKNIQTYGLILLEYNHDIENLINSRNRLRFKIKYNISKEFMKLPLQYILSPKKIKTED